MYIILNILIVINNCLTFHTWIGLYNILLHLHHILLRTNVGYLLIVTSSTCRTEYFACKGKVKIRRKNWECGMHCTCLLHMCPFFCLILHAWPCAFVCWLKVCVHVNVCVCIVWACSKFRKLKKTRNDLLLIYAAASYRFNVLRDFSFDIPLS